MPDLEREELRIALALNGGVGLAVWIGGVANELERLVSRRDSYGPLLDLTNTDARVDVISGSSAGGINGALLAMAITHGKELAPLRSLWVEQGDLAELVRDPMDRQASSLMRGDDYFLPELRRAFASLWNPNPATRRPPETAPIVLTLTTTLLHGEPNRIPDDYGTVITDVDYKAKFVFERGPQSTHGADPFADQAVIDQLALAARSTASFPGAFESSFIPMTGASASPTRPDMTAFLRPPLDQDRFVVDGGVLDNKPVATAAADIFKQRASRPVRRLLAYVVPDPGTVPDAQRPLPGADDAPSVAAIALASLFTLPRYQSISDELRLLRDHNRQVQEHDRARLSLVRLVAPATILRVARDVFPVYRAARKDASIRYIVEEVSAGLAAQTQGGLPFQGRREWLHSVFNALDLPWVPQGPPVTGPPPPDAPTAWHWGNRAVEKITGPALSLLRETQSLAGLIPRHPQPELAKLWNDAFDVVADSDRLRAADRAFWRRQSQQLLETGILTESSRADLGDIAGGVRTWLTETLAAWEVEPFSFSVGRFGARTTIAEAAGVLARDLSGTVTRAKPVADQVLQDTTGLEHVAGVREARDSLRHLASFLVPEAGATSVTLRHLLALHVAMSALGGTDVVEQAVELIQISGETPSSVGGPDHARDKLAGIQMGHFGAFYRRSWRANDWMQGRLDGARRIAQIVLSPTRLRAVPWGAHNGSVAPAAAEAIAQLAWGGVADDRVREALQKRFDAGAVRRELEFLDHPEVPPPEMLPTCIDTIARRLQLEILLDELPQLYQATLQDEATGAGPVGKSANFAQAYRVTVGTHGTANLAPEVALALYSKLHIGEEKLTDDMGSDLFSSTISRVLATSALVLSGQNLRFGFLQNALRLVRAPLLLLYLMVRSATGGRAGAIVNAILLTGGGLVVGLDLLTKEGLPGILVTAGWAAFAAGLLLILLRTRLGILRILVPVAVVAGLAALTVWIGTSHGVRAFFNNQRLEAVIIIVLVGVLVYVGSLRQPGGSATNRVPAQRWRWRNVVGVEVDGEAWARVGSLRSAAPEAQVFTLRWGRVRFGDGVHGQRPRNNAEVTVHYR